MFRNIRNNLLQEGKAGPYFKYAVGEMVLVVVGILIVLKVNTWDQDRQSSIENSRLLKLCIMKLYKKLNSLPTSRHNTKRV